METAAMNASPTAYTVAGVSHQMPKGDKTCSAPTDRFPISPAGMMMGGVR
jgi:hypothetical protein